jgi:hypothetical protein
LWISFFSFPLHRLSGVVFSSSYKAKLLLKKLRQSRVFFTDCQEEQKDSPHCISTGCLIGNQYL